MEELIILIAEVIKVFPWIVVLVTVRTVYANKPKNTKITYKDFMLESTR